jgi:hypothetical protein
MLSLAGLPPFAGFLAKFYIFLAVVAVHMYALAVLGVLASVVGAYYYLRVVKIMYFDDPAPAFDGEMSWSLARSWRLRACSWSGSWRRAAKSWRCRCQRQSASSVSDAPAWPEGYALKHFKVIDSTNEEARRLAPRASAVRSGLPPTARVPGADARTQLGFSDRQSRGHSVPAS